MQNFSLKVQLQTLPVYSCDVITLKLRCHVNLMLMLILCLSCPLDITLPSVRCPTFQCNPDAWARLLQGSKNPLQDFPSVPDTKHVSVPPAVLLPSDPRLGLCLVSETAVETLRSLISGFPRRLSGHVAGRADDHG